MVGAISTPGPEGQGEGVVTESEDILQELLFLRGHSHPEVIPQEGSLVPDCKGPLPRITFKSASQDTEWGEIMRSKSGEKNGWYVFRMCDF